MIVKQKVVVEKVTGATKNFFHLNFLVDSTRCKNLEFAVQQANREYLRKGNQPSFNWMDFWENVPNELCWKYGFQKEIKEMPTMHVSDTNPQLFYPMQVAVAS